MVCWRFDGLFWLGQATLGFLGILGGIALGPRELLEARHPSTMPLKSGILRNPIDVAGRMRDARHLTQFMGANELLFRGHSERLRKINRWGLSLESTADKADPRRKAGVLNCWMKGRQHVVKAP